MNKLKTAVVGVGSLGRHHLRWLAELEQSQLVGLCDLDGDKANKFAEEFSVKAFSSVEELATQVDVASIVVSTKAHYEIASKLIKAGVHCLIEKPITATLDEAIKLQALAGEHDVKVTVGHIERFNPAVRSLEAIDVRPKFIEAHRLAPFDPRGTDVAVVLDLMIHDIDLVLHFIKSSVVDIQASAVAVISPQADIANARLTFANGAVANLTASRISLQPMRKLRIFQQSGYYSLDLAKKQADLYRLAAPGDQAEGMRLPFGKSDKEIVYTKMTDSGDDMLGSELGAFLDSVRNDQPPAVLMAEATEALRIALEVARIGTQAVGASIPEEPS